MVLLVLIFQFCFALQTSGLFEGDKIDLSHSKTAEDFDEIIRKLMLTGHYQKVSVVTAAEGLKIEAQPIHRVRALVLKGNKNFSSRELVAVTKINVGDRFDRDKITQQISQLKAFYGENGFYNAVIELEFLKQTNGDFIIQVSIDEKNPCQIQAILIESPNIYLQKKIKENLKHYLKKPLSENARVSIQNEINEYLTEEHFLRSELKDFEVQYNPEKTKVTLVYTISDGVQYDVVPIGIEKISAIEFYQSLNLSHIERTSLDPSVTLIDRVKTYYLSRGYANVMIKTLIEERSKFIKRLKMIVREGGLVRLQAINVVGRISRSPSYYSNFIIDASSPLLQLGYYNRQDVEIGSKNLMTQLKNEGFLKARLQSTRSEFSSDKKSASVEVNLDEGPLCQVRQVSFEGIKAFSNLELSEVIPTKANQPLIMGDVEKSLDLLKKYYFARGYLEMKILNSDDKLIDYNDQGTQANLHFRIFEGPRIRVSQIVVEGNNFTDSRVVLREIAIHPGDILKYDDIELSTVRLNKFGIFSRVEIHTLEDNTDLSDRTLIVSVTEREPGIFRYGAGVNSSRGVSLRGFTGLNYNNLFGTGRALSARIEANYNLTNVQFLENKIAAGYFEPFLFGTRTRGRINVSRGQYVFYWAQHYDFSGQSQDVGSYTVLDTNNRIDFLLERDIGKRIRLIWTLLGIDSQFTYERNNHPIAITPQVVQSNETRVNSIGPTIDFDYRDNPFLPTKGHYARFDAAYADPSFGGSKEVQFIKTEATYSYYKTLGATRLVWTNSVRGGYETSLLRQTDSSGNIVSGIPASYAFFLGGFNTIRGFDPTNPNERIPANYDVPFTYPNELIIHKDSSFYLLKTELRFPIVGDFGGVVFYDGGSVQVTGHRFRHPYRHSVGFGVRINTPVGPASLDIGFKINPLNEYMYDNAQQANFLLNEPPVRVHFYIGTF